MKDGREAVKLLLIGAKRRFNAEYFYARAFAELGASVDVVDQYVGLRRGDLARIVLSRVGVGGELFRRRLPVNRLVRGLRLGEYDAVVVFKGEFLDRRVLELLSEYNVWLFWPDTLRYLPLLRGRLQFFRGVFVATDRHDFFFRLGARRVVTVRWACDPEVHRPVPAEKVYDVSFVGTFYWHRWRVLRHLRRRPHVFGGFWILKAGVHHPPVYGEDYAKVVSATRVNLNIHHPRDLVADAPNMRTFEVACMGGFLLTEDMPSLRSLFSRVATYRGIDDLNEKVEYYLSNDAEREEVAARMREEALARHTYLHRAEELMGVILT
ncbi:conserved hypothetical protein [Pyrobaculum islandicum DSM 4184]|uniref:Spore protein YkvP/CgeB glycosyl transferase-like domain-containing protein n=1 Tax=Pyrobaculum islandicum (strain DSM 4184 / JCM 9189 / GEO3) TaxID=384616 RepID=A1RUM6_PYRIL|nr:glycosyltransferase [Pyrobaculum islandicum]ABL88658.1 conserved hypothetical protein [Pyrobaculum islandicum DSM 4184]